MWAQLKKRLSVDYISHGLAIAGIAGFTLAAAWEIADDFGAGHYAAGPAYALAAQNMLRFGIYGAITDYYPIDPPSPSSYYCHHPIGWVWVLALFVKIFGAHDWVVRLPAVLMSGASAALLSGIGRHIGGALAGAIAVLSFVSLPIALAFCNLSNLEVPTIFWILVAIYGYARFQAAPQYRYLLLSILGFVGASLSDWPGLLFSGFSLVFLGQEFFRKPQSERGLLRFGQFWYLTLLAVGAGLAATLGYFYAADKFFDFLQAGQFRSTGANTPLLDVLRARRYWLVLCFTPLVIALGILATPVVTVRAFRKAPRLEMLALALLLAALVHYLAFKNAADIHVFWPHYFAPYFALAMASASTWFVLVLRQLARRFKRPRWERVVPACMLAAAVLGAGLVLRDGLRVLVYARESGGRLDEKGNLMLPDFDNVAFMRWLSQRVAPREGAKMDGSIRPAFWMSWVFQHPLRFELPLPNQPAQGLDRYYLLDARNTYPSELLRIAKTFSVSAVGPFWAIDRAAPHSPLLGFDFVRRAPGILETLLISAHHDMHAVSADDFATWEWREHLGQTPNPAPASAPVPAPSKAFETNAQMPIWHNVLVSQGDVAGANQVLTQIRERCLPQSGAAFSDGTELLGVAFESGATKLLTLYFKAAQALPFTHFEVKSRMLEKLAGSITPLDPKERAVGALSRISPELWRAGYVYAMPIEIIRRPGKEHFYGSFRGMRAPLATSGAPVPLITLD